MVVVVVIVVVILSIIIQIIIIITIITTTTATTMTTTTTATINYKETWLPQLYTQRNKMVALLQRDKLNQPIMRNSEFNFLYSCQSAETFNSFN